MMRKTLLYTLPLAVLALAIATGLHLWDPGHLATHGHQFVLGLAAAPAVFTPDAFLGEGGLKRLDKQSKELVLAFVEALSKRSVETALRPTESSLLKAWRLRKANPQPGDVYVSQLLTDLSIAFMQDEGAFMAATAGEIPVDQQAGQFNQYDRADQWRIDPADARRGISEESKGGGFGVSQVAYATELYAWHKDVDEQLQGNQRVGDPVNDALAYVIQSLLILRDIVWADAVFKTGLWGVDLDGVAGAPGAGQFKQWDQAGSSPRGDLSAQATAIHQKTGAWPNELILQPFVLKALLLNAEVTDAFKYTTAGSTPTLQALAAALVAPAIAGVQAPRIRVAGGIKTTSAEGAADATAYIAGKHALLAYQNPNPSLRSHSAFHTFTWTGLLGSNERGIRIKDYPIQERAITHRVEGETAFQVKLVAAVDGAFFESAVA